MQAKWSQPEISNWCPFCVTCGDGNLRIRESEFNIFLETIVLFPELQHIFSMNGTSHKLSNLWNLGFICISK